MSDEKLVDAAGKTQEERVQDLCGELRWALALGDSAMRERIVRHHVGVLWQTIIDSKAHVPPCPKCGSTDIHTNFRAKGVFLDPRTDSVAKAKADLLRRCCQNCGYCWNDKPLEQEHNKDLAGAEALEVPEKVPLYGKSEKRELALRAEIDRYREAGELLWRRSQAHRSNSKDTHTCDNSQIPCTLCNLILAEHGWVAASKE